MLNMQVQHSNTNEGLVHITCADDVADDTVNQAKHTPGEDRHKLAYLIQVRQLELGVLESLLNRDSASV